MYFGLFVKVRNSWLRVDTTTGYTLDTAKERFKGLAALLISKGLRAELRKLPSVKLVEPFAKDKFYARTPW